MSIKNFKSKIYTKTVGAPMATKKTRKSTKKARKTSNKTHKKSSKSCPTRLDRIFVLDTNILLHDPDALFAFKNVIVGIPFIVLEELDMFKRETGEKGRNAREVIRTLDELRTRGSLHDGVPLNHDTDGALLKVFHSPEKISFSQETDIHAIKDNLIIQTSKNLAQNSCHVTLVSKDINVRVKADVLGIEAEDYTKGTISSDKYYKGWIKLPMPAQDLKKLSQKTLAAMAKEYTLYPNQFIIAHSENNPENNKLFRHLGAGKEFKEVAPITIMDKFHALNIQQLMALDLLMDDDIKLLSLLGPAGTGKTFLTLLAGLYKVAQVKAYRKFLVTRPIVALGADIGYLPGDIQEKLHYWMQPVHDNLEFIASEIIHEDHDLLHLGSKKKQKKTKKKHPDGRPKTGLNTQFVEHLERKGILSLEAITYMRGRSIPYQFVFIDEVQNLTPHEVKTLVSRAGQGTKVILAGDPYQIDSPYLDFTSNGLTVTTEKLKEYSIFGTTFLEKSERSELAQLTADVL